MSIAVKTKWASSLENDRHIIETYYDPGPQRWAGVVRLTIPGPHSFMGWTADVPEFLWPDTEPCWAKVVNGR